MASMVDVIQWVQNTPIPLALVASGLACMILAIASASELPPRGGEPPLLTPQKSVPITGTILLLLGVLLSVQ